MGEKPKRVLCFGDSNTWGWTPGSGERYAPDSRWPDILDSLLGESVTVLADGVPGRTNAVDDPVDGVRCGVSVLADSLQRHAPLELVIIMLGTNDLKGRFELTAGGIAEGMGKLIPIVRAHGNAAILIVSPPPLGPAAAQNALFAETVGISHDLAAAFERVAAQAGCAFVNAGDIVQSSPRDGVHWEPQAHRTFAEYLASRVPAMLAV